MLSVSDPSAVRFNLSTTQTQPHAWGLQQFHQHGKVSETSWECSCHRQFPAIHGGSWDVLHADARRAELHDYDSFVSSAVSLILHTHEIQSGPESVYEGSSIHPSDARNIPGKQQSARSFLFRERSNLWKTFIYSYYIYIYDGLYRLNYAFSVCR